MCKSTVRPSLFFLYIPIKYRDLTSELDKFFKVGELENIIKDYNYDLNTGKTWDLNLKWKPEHENTIDFLLKEEKDEIANYNDYKINQSNIKTQTVKVGNEKNIYDY